VAFESNYITFIGNMTDDPRFVYTATGTGVATIRLASNRRWTDKAGQQQEETVYMNVNCWRDLAENVAESLKKGDRVVAIGRVRTRSYENKEGQTIWTTEIDADEIAPSLKWAQATVKKTSGNDAGNGANRGGNSRGGQRPAAKPQVDIDELESSFTGGSGSDGPMF
jgi:single-strand DNA-binding protein